MALYRFVGQLEPDGTFANLADVAFSVAYSISEGRGNLLGFTGGFALKTSSVSICI
jgi:hypothetical protein